MKKVLFTLATLFACMTMFAQGQATPFCGVAPVIVFGDADGNEITEVTVTPGVDVECSFILKSMADEVYMVSGFQTQWKMFDASHANIDFATDAKVFCPKVYGGRVKGWLNPVGIGTSDESAGGFDGVSLANEVPYANVYRVMGTNTKYNMVFFHDDADGNPTCPAVFGKFTIRTSEDWADEYATFEFDKAYTLWNQCPGDDPNVFEEASNTEDCVLMIKNANYVAPVTLADPVIAFAEENNVLTVTVSCETEGATLIVNGVAVEGNPYTYTVAHDDIYAEQVVNVTAQSVLGDQTSAEVSGSYTFQAQDQPTADEPVITFDEDGSGVMITIENFTEYTVKVDGEIVQQRNEDYAYVEKVYDKAQSIEVYAKNDPGYPYIAAEKTETYNLPAKVKQQNSTPSVTHSYDPNTGELNVWAYGCTEENVTYTLYCDGVEYTGEMPIMVDTEAGYNHTWTATAVSPTTTVSAVSAPDAIVIEGIVPPTVTPDPTINVDTDPETGVVTITVKGQGTVTASVTTGAGTTNYTDEDGDGEIVITLYPGEYEDMANVNATALLPGDNVVAGAASENFIVIPAKTAKPVITYEEVDGGVQVTVTGNGTLNVLIDGYGDGDVITYTGAGPYTYFLASTADDQEVTVSANAQEEGKVVSDYAIEDIIVPAAQPVNPDNVGQPTFQGYTVDGVTGYGVYIFPSVPADADIMYRVLVWDPVTEEWTVRNDWTPYTGAEKEIWFENNGEKVRVEAYAYVGENRSDVAAYEFTVETALNELMGGKTVAGVRYFNMAGQEMQEANGMTIVVTTYTDGTTSAVKVMK